MIAILADVVECGKRVSEYGIVVFVAPRKNSSGSSRSIIGSTTCKWSPQPSPAKGQSAWTRRKFMPNKSMPCLIKCLQHQFRFQPFNCGPQSQNHQDRRLHQLLRTQNRQSVLRLPPEEKERLRRGIEEGKESQQVWSIGDGSIFGVHHSRQVPTQVAQERWRLRRLRRFRWLLLQERREDFLRCSATGEEGNSSSRINLRHSLPQKDLERPSKLRPAYALCLL